MIEFVRKHWGCTALMLTPFCLLLYWYFGYFRYEDDRYEDRQYPITLTEKWTKTIEYKTLPNVKFKKYFLITFNSKQLREKLNQKYGERYYEEIYKGKKYEFNRVWDLTNEEFYAEGRAEKPHFLLKIFKNGKLLETQDIYFSYFKSYWLRKIGDREIPTTDILGQLQPRYGANYQFEEDSTYQLEITNNKGMSEFQDVETYFTIKPILTKR